MWRPPKFTKIYTENIEISNEFNTNVTEIYFYKQVYVKYLPINVASIFPKIFQYDADHNAIKKINNENFKGLVDLKQIDLHHNFITSIESEAFNGLVNLDKITLNVNRLRSLDEKLFNHLINLEYIFLNNNPITSLNDAHFDKNVNLDYVVMDFMKLKQLSPTMFDNKPKLSRVFLANNTCIDKNYGENLRWNEILSDEYKNELKADIAKSCTAQIE